ncbi:MAG TPA: TlpA disulfide reductase family protein [Thermoanaerobaculaceae bacterium]|nr:TlpA disulfide reductase family protein [Thermoanaerobaculaceae bacterium]
MDASARDVMAAVGRARGDVVLVNVWATWCEPCREEFPDLMRLRREMSGKPFALILVSADFPDVKPEVTRFLAQYGVDFPTFLKSQGDTEFINGLDPRWSGALPATILYGADGVKRGFWEGKADYATFVERVSALLPPAAARPAGSDRDRDRPTSRRRA